MRREVVPGEVMVDRVATAKSPGHKPHESLSPREQEIMIAIASGHSLKAVAMDLGISIKTVSTYKKRLFDKMKFKNDAELIGYILSNNLLPNNFCKTLSRFKVPDLITFVCEV
jgi:DNA-binding NarL/FixJ family response regulator